MTTRPVPPSSNDQILFLRSQVPTHVTIGKVVEGLGKNNFELAASSALAAIGHGDLQVHLVEVMVGLINDMWAITRPHLPSQSSL